MSTRQSRILDRALSRLKLRQLRLLIAVSEAGNIQAAARGLNMSQPAASKMIQDLEIDFEVALFDRTNRGVIPTSHGEALIRHGRLIFAQLSNAAQEMDDLTEGASGRVVVGTLLAASACLLPKAIQQVLADRPNVAIKVVDGTNDVLMPALRNGEIDMVVGRLPTHNHRHELEQIPLYQENIEVVVGPEHPLVGKNDLTFDDLRPFGWILPPAETSLRLLVDQFFVDMRQYSPERVIESVSYLTNRALLKSSDLIGFMPSAVPQPEMEAGQLHVLPYTLPFGTGAVGITVRAGGGLSPAALAMMDALKTIGTNRQSATGEPW
ncbi:MAG: LysR substrate-binding domain-containing protein [Pseudomonadota bacterium]